MSNRIPREFIQQLLARIDIVDLIDGRVPLKKKSGNNYFACCPFHAEKSASFSVSHVKQFYHCFGCGAHGNAIDFLMQFDRLSFPESVETLAKQFGLDIPKDSAKQSVVHKPSHFYDLLEKIAAFYYQQLCQTPRAHEYLINRGLSGKIAKAFHLGFAPAGWDHIVQHFGTTPELKNQLFETGMLIKKEDGGFYDRFRDRIMFPIHDRRGRIVGFGGRILEKGEPKYLNSPETLLFQKGRELYGLYFALQHHRELKRIVIVEGYMDVIGLFQHGITYVVATLGTATTANHLERLFRYSAEIIFCFDGDSAGRTAAWRALITTFSVMKDGIQVRFMFLPENEDPDSFIRKVGPKAFEDQMKEALPLSEFFFQTLAEQTNLASTDGRARFIKDATQHIDQLPEGIFQQIMLEELAKRTRTNVQQLKSHVKPRAPHLIRPSKIRPPSALRVAISLLIQNPHLATLIQEPLPPFEIKGYDVLIQIINTLHNHPNLNTGALLEYWRDRPEHAYLAKLAQTLSLAPEKGIQQEFLGAIQRLRKSAHKQTIDQILNKASQYGLSSEEKQQLNELIQSQSE